MERRFEVKPWFPTPAAEPCGRALVLPGGRYTVDHPLLFWACQVLTQVGWRVVTMRWRAEEVSAANCRDFVEAAADRLDAEVGGAERTLVLAKSLGCYAAAWAGHRGYPGIWLTPVLTDPFVADTLRDYAAPSLVLGGTADPMWVRPTSVPSGQRLVEIDGVDHSLHRPADWEASLDALRLALSAVQEFAADTATAH